MNDVKHYGTKGMRWGVRKDKSSSGVKKASELTDAQLQSAVKRLRLEQEYSKLTANSTTNKSGNAQVNKVVRDFGTKFINQAITKSVNTLVNSAIEKVAGR